MFVPQYPYPIVGGLEKQSHELSKALIAQGVAVQVVSGKILKKQPNVEIVEGVPVRRIRWSRLKPVRFLMAPLDIAYVLWSLRHDYDVIHLHQHSWVGLFVILLAKLLGKPILTKLPNVGDFGLPGLRRLALGRLRQKVILKSDAIVAMSSASQRELADLGYPPERVFLSPNGIALTTLPGLESKVDRAIVEVVFVGRLTEQKQIDVLLNAWAQVCASGDCSGRLSIWGDGPLESALKSQCDRLGIASSVRFTGNVERVVEKLPAMDVFVLPSRAEGNSNAILEAMVAGLPIISAAVGGTPMLLGEDGKPFLILPGDARTLSTLLLRLIKDRNLRISTGLAMRRRVEQHFAISHVAQRYSQVYGCLASGQIIGITEASNPVVLEDSGTVAIENCCNG